MPTPRIHVATRQRGFSLVEVMVGMVVGLVVTIIIYQVVATYEGVKRSTTSGADAQQNGLFSLSTIERDVRAAGWGIPSADIMRCSLYYTFFDNGGALTAVPDFPKTPVRIVDGGTGPGASDRIVMMWGTSVRANVLNALLQNVVANPPATPAAHLQPTTKVGLSTTGGFVWLTDDNGNCALSRITASTVNGASPTTVILSNDPFPGTAAAPSYNATAAFMTAYAWPINFNTNPRIFDVGALTQRTYSVVNGSLMAQDYFSSVTNVQVADNVVALKAQYGISAAGSQVVNNWVSAVDGGAAGNWATVTQADLKRIKALRIAVVARSTLKERLAAGATACSTTTVAPTSWPGGPVIDLSADPDWRCYRYRSFTTVVPLRNVLWANLS